MFLIISKSVTSIHLLRRHSVTDVKCKLTECFNPDRYRERNVSKATIHLLRRHSVTDVKCKLTECFDPDRYRGRNVSKATIHLLRRHSVTDVKCKLTECFNPDRYRERNVSKATIQFISSKSSNLSSSFDEWIPLRTFTKALPDIINVMPFSTFMIIFTTKKKPIILKIKPKTGVSSMFKMLS